MTVEGVVTAVGSSGLYIQDAAGGEWSGIYVFLGSSWSATWGSIHEGDILEVQGFYQEYFDVSEVNVRDSPTGSVSLVDFGAPPWPETIGLDEVGESWEGVLIEVTGVTVSNPASGSGTFEITSPTGAYGTVGDDLHLWGSYAGLSVGDPLSSVVGVVDESYGLYPILPRSDADLTP